MKLTPPSFNTASVMVVGDIMLDRYWYGPTYRISPEAPVPVVKVNTIEERPGGAANVAINIAALGASARLIGLIGEDDAARILIKKLHTLKVQCDCIVLKNHLTITKLRVLSHNQQLIRIDFEENFDDIDPILLYNRVYQALSTSGALVLSDYAKGTLNSIQEIIQLAREVNVPVLIDPKGTNFDRYRGATLLTPNLSEFEAIVGKCKTEDQIMNRGMQLLVDYEISALLITRSENGMTLLQKGKDPLHLPTQAQEVFDVTGAGDTVIGVLASVIAAGQSLEEACFFANAAAGLVVGKLGTSTVNTFELENATSSFGVMTEEELKAAVAISHQRGEKIVMTNGVFDILHAGHVSYLINARKLGDRLIVAVNSDQSTKRIKGKNRPVNSLKNRMVVLSALAAVDWVVSFEEDTPQRLIAAILPDLLVKGGDYKLENIVGSKEIWDNGGDVCVINLEHNISTTNIIKTIRDN
ncbi:bifunctional D-glycero-beta-D-manno-heptose-7-phosphate kinase/D-glycero-beta-D-manno-heptose 1-phosphate adenylyltransferase HldE [Pantoea sp. Aalb]|uniref:bifunctional D-glycero-beta-D-manno-heptose-7-phosphate kinase/D-glycero-beta-D-manno-heptose 1-phosphate adenylyltransferase HldE n=1 Tax=Pantoea sp. Aalb TaxID=2576762 RepID=UPI0013232D13|nr:bifunctional D-glycero-beta-D-manno-heptose-7-phosphate kinase/D-glycero-beta-D-manno-heptose 1-phosphate adenylyltransferase HldE [Pantoea sp. Aalb]MXP67705.1 bifunctional D-glycero-beta-D-manno-heptose-7-phosphate kinase/D-glycero-beta-D-manno-heptose 1-phosphate adenylyltransferase HldE [Pantoea sp. Aalb]